MRVVRCGSGFFVAGAGDREVVRCDGGDISWQVQYFVRVRRCGYGKFCGWRVSGRCLEGLESRNCLAGLLDVCAPMGVSA